MMLWELRDPPLFSGTIKQIDAGMGKCRNESSQLIRCPVYPALFWRAKFFIMPWWELRKTYHDTERSASAGCCSAHVRHNFTEQPPAVMSRTTILVTALVC